ncbi:hypothetical protein ACLESO_14825 [Pyxidicoccus sp. 3LG]
MSPRPMARALAGLVLLLALTPGCASMPEGTGGSGSGGDVIDPGVPSPTDSKAVRAEVAQVASHVWGVAESVRDVQSRLVFTFWAEPGALTLTGYRSEDRGGRRGKPANADSTRSQVEAALSMAMQAPARELTLTLRRGESSWEVEHSTFIQSFRPVGARTRPSGHGILSAAPTFSAVSKGMQGLLAGVHVPADGSVYVDLDVGMRNGRVVSWNVVNRRVLREGRGGTPRPVSTRVSHEVANVILLYAQGVGNRTLHLGLRLSQARNEPADGWVEETRVEHAMDGSENVARQ